MKVPRLAHILAGIVCLGLLLAPIFIIMLALIGLELYTITGDQATALWICGVAVGASVLLTPIAYWCFSPTSSGQKTIAPDGLPVAKQSEHIRGLFQG